MTPPATVVPADHPQALPAGARLDQYEVELVLSASDAGIRYRCRDGDERFAVLECFPAALVRREEERVVAHTARTGTAFATMLDEFLRDTGNAASFRHPGVVPLHRTFRANGTVYALMDYVEGETLATYLARESRFPSKRLEGLMTGLVTSLGALHGASLLHLGVEPGEIVLTGDDSPVVLATTLMRRNVGGSRHAFAEVQQQRRSAFVTSPYAAIELYAKGGQIGPWSDLYGLAATLYHCMVGEAPPAALDRVLHDDLQTVAADREDPIDIGIVTAVNAALHIQPDQRPRSVDGWRMILQGTSSAHVGPTQIGARGGGEAGTRGSRRPRWAIAALALVAMTAVISYVDTGILRSDGDVPDVSVAATPEPTPDAPDGEDPAADTPDLDTLAALPTADPEAAPPLDDAAGEAADADTQAADGSPHGDGGDYEIEDTPEPAAEVPALASLLVETVPSGMEVWIAGEQVGRTPLQLEGLTPGARDVSLRHPLYRTMNLPGQEFVGGEQLYIERRLARATGSLTVTTEPPGAWVEWREERVTDATPATLEGLPAGSVVLRVGASGYGSETVSAQIPKDGAGELTWTLTRAYGTLTLDLLPTEASVTVLGEDGGDYFAGMELPEGPHRIEVAHAGHLPQTLEVDVAGDTLLPVVLQKLPRCGLNVRGVPPAVAYPVQRTFRGVRQDAGAASILVAFTVLEDGTVARDEVQVDAERSTVDQADHFGAFSEAAAEAVRRYEFDFEEGTCSREQRVSMVIRFRTSAER